MNSDYKVGDLIYDGMNSHLLDLPFYKRSLAKNEDARILALCFDTGRLTRPIARDSYNINGVDYTSSMLEQVKL